MIKTERLTIQKISLQDQPALRRIADDFACSPYAAYDLPLPTDGKSVAQFAASGLFYGVFLERELIGYICFHEEGDCWDLGYCFHSAYYGKGYAYESCKALLASAPVRRFTAGTALANTPSVRLLERLGFTLTGTETLSFQPGTVFEGGLFQLSRSSLYRELTSAELAAVLKTTHFSARLLTGGLFNTTYLVELPLGKAVLRVGPVNRQLLMPFEHHLMEAESRVYRLCAAHGIPASEVLAVDTSKTVIDRDYMLVRYIPSKPMSQAELGEARNRICRRIGQATAKLHAITAPRFGRIVGPGFERWSEALLWELSEWETLGYWQEQHREAEILFEKAIPYLDEICTPCLVHTDLWAGNILISPEPDFAAIIDADRALWGDPEFEFSSIWWTLGEEAFWEGYGKRLSGTYAARVRRGIYHLLNRLWNSYVYQMEYNQPENARKEQELALKQIEELKDLYEHPEC
ncbi:MAG: GNAT family N-acetyltransferase [Clostridia bacterium]|nr:GNAT family N-acetyltransferase [Clostridia bacterium]